MFYDKTAHGPRPKDRQHIDDISVVMLSRRCTRSSFSLLAHMILNRGHAALHRLFEIMGYRSTVCTEMLLTSLYTANGGPHQVAVLTTQNFQAVRRPDTIMYALRKM